MDVPQVRLRNPLKKHPCFLARTKQLQQGLAVISAEAMRYRRLKVTALVKSPAATQQAFGEYVDPVQGAVGVPLQPPHPHRVSPLAMKHGALKCQMD